MSFFANFEKRNAIKFRMAYAPIRYAQIYLWGGFFVFLLTGRALLLDNTAMLIVFVSAAHFALLAGYLIGVGRNARLLNGASFIAAPNRLLISRWVLLSALYYFAYGVLHLQEYGASGPAEILERLLRPGDAYAAKFDVYEAQFAEGRVNLGIQVIVLLGALQAALIPLLIIFWDKLSGRLRLFSIVGIVVYVLFFFFIGTMKGLGDVVIYGAVGLLIRVWRKRLTGDLSGARRRGIRAWWQIVVFLGAVLLFFSYMVSSMQSRLDVLGGGVEDNGFVEEICNIVGGDAFGPGLAVAITYPVGGYYGLDKNLSVPFEWSYGLGSMRALSSYKNQYFGGYDYFEKSYPARTEAATGYPALMYWQTIYPWLASDLTYFGAIFAMLLIGVFFARLWIECVVFASPISIALFGQICVLVIFIPANNQIFASRVSFIGFLSLLFIYVLKNLFRRGVKHA